MAMVRDISYEAAVANRALVFAARSFIYAANNQLVNFQAPHSSTIDRVSANR
jgi:hypothetical protein